MDCSWIGWCALKPEAQAAWAQAILTVVTFVVALVVQARSNAKRRKEAELQRVKLEKLTEKNSRRFANALGLSIIPDIRDVGVSAKTILDLGVDQPGGRHGLITWFGQKRHFETSVVSTGNLLEATEPVHALLRLLDLVSGYARLLKPDTPLTVEQIEFFNEMLPTLRTRADDAQNAVTALRRDDAS